MEPIDLSGSDSKNRYKNLALGKPARQSSLSAWSLPREAKNAVNGRKSGRFSFHTERENRPWWHVDLGSTCSIRRIVVYNRMDAGSDRAYTLKILIGVSLRDLAVIHSQDGRPFGGAEGEPLVVDMDGIGARYVRIQLESEDALHLDQVEVYGEEIGESVSN